MIEELEGTVAETLRRLATETLDPRDEAVFREYDWSTETGSVWVLQGRFLESGYGFRLRGDFTALAPISDAIGANRTGEAYRATRRTLLPHLDAWLRIGLENPWIRRAYDPPFTERSFALCRTAGDMARVVDRNNWTLGQAFVLAGTDVCMIQQCEGPGEFLMIRGPVAFDSWTTGAPWIHGARLAAYLDAVVRADLDDRGRPQWYELVCPPAGPGDRESGFCVAETTADLARLLA